MKEKEEDEGRELGRERERDTGTGERRGRGRGRERAIQAQWKKGGEGELGAREIKEGERGHKDRRGAWGHRHS